MTEPTDADRRKAGSMLLNMHGKELPMRASIIAAALAEARENERERTLQGATVAQIQATPRRQIADQQARHEVELRALQSQIAELQRERDRLRGALKAPGLYQPIDETPEAVAVRHLKGVDQDPPLRSSEEPGP